VNLNSFKNEINTYLGMGSYCGFLYKIVVSIGNDLAKDPASPKLLGI
jgi:hypothetical protein